MHVKEREIGHFGVELVRWSERQSTAVFHPSLSPSVWLYPTISDTFTPPPHLSPAAADPGGLRLGGGACCHGNLNCTRRNCGAIDCKGENTTLSLSLSCSPIGMIIGAAVVDMSGFLAENTTLFTESGVFAGDLKVTIHTYTENVLGFGLTVWDPAANVPIDVPLVYYTLIPLDYCDGNGGDAEPHPLNSRCLYNTSFSVA